MAGFDHGPNQADETDLPEDAARRSGYGLKLFALYLLLYGGFMLMNTFAPRLMATWKFAGVNLAILYGFVLILAALLLALVYAWLCKAETNPPSASKGTQA